MPLLPRKQKVVGVGDHLARDDDAVSARLGLRLRLPSWACRRRSTLLLHMHAAAPPLLCSPQKSLPSSAGWMHGSHFFLPEAKREMQIRRPSLLGFVQQPDEVAWLLVAASGVLLLLCLPHNLSGYSSVGNIVAPQGSPFLGPLFRIASQVALAGTNVGAMVSSCPEQLGALPIFNWWWASECLGMGR